MAEQVLSKTTAEIFGDGPARSVIEAIFSDLHPGFMQEDRAISSIFTPQSANQFLSQLMDLKNALGEMDSYETTVQKLQVRIAEAEKIKDDLLAQVFRKLRPISAP